MLLASKNFLAEGSAAVPQFTAQALQGGHDSPKLLRLSR
jgi:hypothetical protein